MNTSELHHVKSGSSGNEMRVVGWMPRISTDIRIKCPRSFNGHDSPVPPPPPSLKYVEIALGAATKIATATWFCRQYLEAIRVGYTLDEHSPFGLYITGDVVIVTPAIAIKTTVSEKVKIAGGEWNRDYTGFDLNRPLAEFDEKLLWLTEKLIEKIKALVASQNESLEETLAALRRYQEIFTAK